MTYRIIYHPLGKPAEYQDGFPSREAAFNWLQNSGIEFDAYHIVPM